MLWKNFHVPSTFCTSQLRHNTNLHIASFSSTFHPACNIYRVAPNVVVRLFGANYSGYNRTLTDSLKKERKIVNWKYRRFWKRTFTFSSFVQVEPLSTYLLSINLQRETKCDNSPTLRTNWLKHSALIESSLSLKASAKSTTVTTCSQFSLCWDWTSKQKIISTRMWTTASTFSFYYYWYQKLDRRFSAKACNNLVLSSYVDKLVIGLASKFRHVFNSS